MKLDWRRAGHYRALTTVGDISLDTYFDPNLDPPCKWSVEGYAEDREEAMKRAEAAALSALPPPPPTGMLDTLMRLAHEGRAYLVVDGRRELPLTFDVLRAAVKGAAVPTVLPPLPKKAPKASAKKAATQTTTPRKDTADGATSGASKSRAASPAVAAVDSVRDHGLRGQHRRSAGDEAGPTGRTDRADPRPTARLDPSPRRRRP